MPLGESRKSQRTTGQFPSALAAGILAIALWSTAATVAGMLHQYVDYGAIALFPVMIAAATFSVVILPTLKVFLRETRALDVRAWVTLTLASSLLATYEICFFYSLTHAPRIQANIINYLWPLCLILFSVLRSRRTEHVSGSDWLLIVLAFTGAALTALDRVGTRADTFVAMGYVSAFIGAASIGLYMSLMRTAAQYHSRSVYTYAMTVTMAIPQIGILGTFIGAHFTISWSIACITLLLYEGIFVFAIGYVAWLYAIRNYSSLSLSAMIYLTPALSIFWLHIVLGDPIVPSAVVGVSIIVTANFYLHSKYRHVTATSSCLVFILVIGMICYVTSGRGRNDPAVGLIDVVATVFAIVAGFSLNRAVSKNQHEETLQTSISSDVQRLLDECRIRGNETLASKPLVMLCSPWESNLQGLDMQGTLDAADRFFRRLVDYDLCGTINNREAMTRSMNHSLRLLFDAVDAITDRGRGTVTATTRIELLDAVDRWLLLRAERLSGGETVAVFALGMLSVILFVLGRPNSLFGDAIATVFSTGVAYLFFALHDYDQNRVDRDYTKLMIGQRFFLWHDFEYYLPYEIVVHHRFPAPQTCQTFRFETPEGEIDRVTLEPEKAIVTIVLRAAYLTSVGALAYLLMTKHS